MISYLEDKWKNYDRRNAKHSPMLASLRSDKIEISDKDIEKLTKLNSEDAIAELTRS